MKARVELSNKSTTQLKMRKEYKMMKKIVSLFLACLMLFALTGGAVSASADNTKPTYTFTFGTVDTEEHPTTMSAHKLAEILEEKAPGRWQIDVFPNSTLGGAAELVESVQMGNVDMACPATSFVANYVPTLGVLDLPYMFTNREEAYAVLDGEIGQQLAKDIETAGMKHLTYWEVGFRCLANSKRPINTVEDVSGLRLRIVSNEVHQALFTALGVDPVPMGLADALVEGYLDQSGHLHHSGVRELFHQVGDNHLAILLAQGGNITIDLDSGSALCLLCSSLLGCLCSCFSCSCSSFFLCHYLSSSPDFLA